jgi:ATP-dependent Clp protease ATP-binding subunit ClpB
MIANLNRRLEDKQLKVTLTDAALNAVIDRGFDPVFGARPLKRYLQSKVETLIARKVIAADVTPGTELTVDLNENGEIVIC